MRLTQRLQLVRSPQDRYVLAVAERKHLPVSEPKQEQVQAYYQRLDALAELMEDSPFTWHLEGGHVLPLRIGRFLRQHADVDVGISQDELGDVVEFLQDKGYDFFYRNYHFKPLEDTPWDLFERTDIGQMKERPLKRLYAMKVKGDGIIDEEVTALREIDLHVHIRNGNAIQTSKQTFSLPYEWFDETVTYQNNGSPSLDIGSLKVFYFFKLGGGRPRHVFDRAVIEERGLLTLEDISEVRALRQ